MDLLEAKSVIDLIIQDDAQKDQNGQAAKGCLIFYAEWNEASLQLVKVADLLGKDYPQVKFIKASVDTAKEIVDFAGGVNTVPVCCFIQGDHIIGRHVGTSPPDLFEMVQTWTTAGDSSLALKGVKLEDGEARRSIRAFVQRSSPAASTDEDKELLKKKLVGLINSSRVILFMKGSKDEPFCRFSRWTTDILNNAGVEYATFDIFSDESVRQGLKEYSNWPTFPQLYVDGELIGGFDIIKEMNEDNSLIDVFPESCLKKPKGGKTPDTNGEKPHNGKCTSLDDRLKLLINQEKVMLFMKGTPDAPFCGFSRRMVSVLKKADIEFGYFDIFTDEEVRQGLKTFSNWPTYPQLYGNGNLIGGIDIVESILESSGVDGLRKELGI